MRITFVLLLLVVTHFVLSIGIAGESVKVKNLHTDTSNTPTISDSATHRNLKGNNKTVTVQEDMEEERSFVDKLKSFFTSNPALSKEVKNLPKDPKIDTSLQKPSMRERVIKNVKSYFGKLKANTSPIERGFIIATILVLIAGLALIVAL